MKIVTTLVAGTTLALTTGAVAQDRAEPMTPPPAEAEAPMTQEMPAPGAEVDTTFTDAEIESFAKAAIKLQESGANPATNPEEATQIVTESGIDAATFNAISQAMQTDPEIAERVQVAAAEIRKQPAG